MFASRRSFACAKHLSRHFKEKLRGEKKVARRPDHFAPTR
jgi:hypothetical protein